MSHSLYITIELACLPESPIEQHKEQGVRMQIKLKGHTNQEKGYTSPQALNCSI